MNRLLVTALGVALAANAGLASAQSYSRYPVDPGPAHGQTVQYDYARVVRVDPVFDAYATSSQGQRCYERPTYVSGGGDDYADDGYYREIRYFIDCILNGRPIETAAPESTRDTISIALAEQESAERNGELIRL